MKKNNDNDVSRIFISLFNRKISPNYIVSVDIDNLCHDLMLTREEIEQNYDSLDVLTDAMVANRRKH